MRSDLQTTAQLSARLGVPARTLLQRAAARGIEPALTVRGAALWSRAQQAALAKAGRRGRPKLPHKRREPRGAAPDAKGDAPWNSAI
jgi:hypothetical protein